MSIPHQLPVDFIAPDTPNLNYFLYGSQYGVPIPTAPAPQSHLDGAAFWYRRDSDMIYLDNQNLGLYNHGPTLPALENPPKHRRTRSGCLTCRSRRVKVSTMYSKKSIAFSR